MTAGLEHAPNTVVSYMYRDASNYKQVTEVVLAGRLNERELAAIGANLDGGEFFIPSQVGLQDLQESWGSRLYEDDHVWHEIDVTEDFQPTHRAPTEDFDVHELARRMSTTTWEVGRAMREHGLDVLEKQDEYAGLPTPAREVVDHVLAELELGASNGLTGEADYAAGVVARLLRVYPESIPAARAAIADVSR